ncbi:hypothetical protein RchiOBHm_Chr3g0476721 [Rosa chinensis]|uniref:Uncharacterized protein n=1 Tax=Rosa chinensis TaxID=74649 RepID=A0A2P6RCR0_ROSCH|nr:hypothetical protein RchiOBHm_Chr3g0476721 [Rosa chinensis]
MTVFPFGHSILFWCLWARGLVNNPMDLKKLLEHMINILPPIVRTKDFNGAMILCLNKITKGLKSRKDFIFGFKKSNP